MASLNKVMLIGYLGRDPEIRYTAAGDAVANLSVATSKSWTDKLSGEKREKTEWHRVILWKRDAEVAGEYLRKGAQIYIEGELETREWEDKDKNKRYTTEIRGYRMLMMGKKDDSQAEPASEQSEAAREYREASSGSSQSKPAPKIGGGIEDMDEDVPF